MLYVAPTLKPLAEGPMVERPSASGIFHSCLKCPPRLERKGPIACQASVIYRYFRPEPIPWLNFCRLDIGDARLVWDTATTEGYLRILFEALKEGLLPEMPILPFHIHTNLWEVDLSVQSVRYRLADSMAPSMPRDIAELRTGRVEVNVQMPWMANMTVEVTVELEEIRAPRNANAPLAGNPMDRAAAFRVARDAWWRPRGCHLEASPRQEWSCVLRPQSPVNGKVKFFYETYTDFTRLRPSQMDGVQSLVHLHLPP